MSEVLYDDHGVQLTRYVGPAGPADPTLYQLTLRSETVVTVVDRITFEQLAHVCAEISDAFIERIESRRDERIAERDRTNDRL